MAGDRRVVVRSYLDDALNDLELAELAARAGNRLGATHLYYAAEKLVKAVRLHHGFLQVKEHHLQPLIEGNGKVIPPIPLDSPWPGRLRVFIHLSDYATSFRYPTDVGRQKPGPSTDEALKLAAALRDLIALAVTELT